jgi:hypothetical protein
MTDPDPGIHEVSPEEFARLQQSGRVLGANEDSLLQSIIFNSEATIGGADSGDLQTPIAGEIVAVVVGVVAGEIVGGILHAKLAPGPPGTPEPPGHPPGPDGGPPPDGPDAGPPPVGPPPGPDGGPPPGPVGPPGPAEPGPPAGPELSPDGGRRGIGDVIAIDQVLATEVQATLLTVAQNFHADFRRASVVELPAVSRAAEPELLILQSRTHKVLAQDAYQNDISGSVNRMVSDALRRSGLPRLAFSSVTAEVRSFGDGDTFQMASAEGHSSADDVRFVYLFHQEPQRFEGGNLRFHRPDDTVPDGIRTLGEVGMRNNRVVLFSSDLGYEIAPVQVASKDSQARLFAITGLLHHAARTY